MKNVLDLLNNKTVIITGANGYIGSSLVNALLNFNTKIFCLSRVKTNINLYKNIQYINTDILNFNEWESLIEKSDIIFHLASQTSLYEIADDPAKSIICNVLPVSRIIAAAEKTKRRIRVIFPSTATIYGFVDKTPVAEDYAINPSTYYDLHKYFDELQLIYAARKGFIESACLRLSNVYGYSPAMQSSNDRGIVNRAILKVLDGKNLEIYGDGNYIRDFIHISDVIDAFLLSAVVKLNECQIFNIGSGEGRTLKNAFEVIIEKAKKHYSKKNHLISVDWPKNSDPIEKRNFVANVDKFSALCGWKAKTNFYDGVELTLRNFDNLN